MLSIELKPIGFDTWEKETWEAYCERLRLPEDEALRQFFRQIPYDHFHHFNDHYPNFEIEAYEFKITAMSAVEAAANIRFFGNQEMRMWCLQYDEFERKNQDYPVFVQWPKAEKPHSLRLWSIRQTFVMRILPMDAPCI